MSLRVPPPGSSGRGRLVRQQDSRRNREPLPERSNSTVESQLLNLILSVASPVAFATAIFYYFGWVRTRAQARELGFDAAVLNLSTTDYILKSVNVLFPIVVPALLILLAAVAGYAGLLRRWSATRVGRSRLLAGGRAARYAAVLSALTGLLLLAVPPVRPVAIPFSLTIAVSLTLLGRDIRGRVSGEQWSWAARLLPVVLLALLVFWDTERCARMLGEQYALDYMARPQQFAALTLYSREDLQIRAAGVTPERLDGEENAYRFRYTGLRLMEKSADRYVLINEVWSDGQGRVIVIRDDLAVRVEFHEPG